MSDLISRADAIEAVCDSCEYKDKCNKTDSCVIYRTLSSLPSADAVQGEWIKHKGKWVDFDFYQTKYECNQCHYCVDEGYDSIFCPNCGAKMKGADDE